ncbi:MAG TPA: TonB-dependent receptor [Bryobacteraceae bacterium]|nr:TonB-dependent receptor [Bryobacteraceae bacterium]HOQ46609.1 TonB-dependent receptor [Bryobacteraceae bacterium]HPQ14257.1 TonB-dependent receptor [Bryobacteraceae bacterium]HPU73958.1 TonB-dependent receptor [Bryobacteraceae bacterium]
MGRSVPFLFAFLAAACFGQTTATLTGTVIDPVGAVVEGAVVTLSNALTGYRHQTVTEEEGRFSIANIPLQTYQLSVEAPGFAPERRTVALRSNVPVHLSFQLRLAEHTTHVQVSAVDSTLLVEPEVTGTRTELSASNFAKLPIQGGNRGLESVLLSFPGFAASANGAIHPRGAHNQMTYVIDGMPISDQLTGSFANAVDPSIIQSIELYTGNVPAEFGNKISGVAVVTTRSGTGVGRGFSGSTQLTASQFDTVGQLTQLAGGTDHFAYFASFNTLKSNRFLDQVSLDNLHNGGNSERAFSRFDVQLTPRDSLRANIMAGRSSFELANLRSQHANGQRQRQLLRDFSASVGWLRALSARTTFDSTVSYRTSIAQLFPSPGDTPVTASQARHLSTLTAGARLNRQEGAHTVRGGFDIQHFPLSENFSFGITSPHLNDPGSPGFIPTLVAHDLTRGGQLFHFSKRAAGNLYSAFIQDNFQWNRFTFSLGVRYDAYRFLVHGYQLQPRVGVAFHLRETNTVFRASYNRTYQTPPNENLLLSSSEEAGVLAPPEVRSRLGSAVVLIRPERQNVYEAGVQQGVGRFVSLNGSFYHKTSRDLQDNDNFLNTGIIFPTSLTRSRVNGAEFRAALVPVRGFSGSLSMTHYHVVVYPPFTGGLFLGSTAIDLLTAGPFVIDHDQKLGMHGVLQYTSPWNLWVSGSVRYDSGLVSNPSDPEQVAADPDYFDLLPYVNLESDPPRVRPRTIVDIAVGYDRMRENRRLWDVSFTLTNVGNTTALYNFQSIFVGTRLVQPRTAGVKLRFYF